MGERYIRRALVVDDSRSQREILSRILADAGWRTMEAEDGRQAMELLSQHPDIELVMLDLHMPVMDGLAFLTELRASPGFAETPKVLMMSVERGVPMVARAYAAGADEYIVKPFSLAILGRKLDSMGFGALDAP